MPYTHKLQLDQSAQYTIQVQGRLDEQWLATFGSMTVTVDRHDDDTIVSTLCGSVLDQAALQGLLRTLYSLGLPLLLVRYERDDG